MPVTKESSNIYVKSQQQQHTWDRNQLALNNMKNFTTNISVDMHLHETNSSSPKALTLALYALSK